MVITNRGGTLEDSLGRAFRRASEILIASAYVGPDAFDSLAFRDLGQRIPVRVVIGRATVDGLSGLTLDYLRRLHAVLAGNSGGIRVATDPFHSKIYTADLSDGTSAAWVGSSNFSGHGLSAWQEANLEVSDAGTIAAAKREAERLWEAAEDITVARVPIREPAARPRAARPEDEDDVVDVLPVGPPGDQLPGLLVTLLDPRTGDVQNQSGLNWWRGGGRARNPNEALIALRAVHLRQAERVFGSAERNTVVDAVTHDAKRFVLRLEGNGPMRNDRQMAKQISTLGDKTAIGRWIMRNCLGLKPGTPVTRDILERYGRTTIGFYRLGTNPASGRTKVLMDFRAAPETP